MDLHFDQCRNTKMDSNFSPIRVGLGDLNIMLAFVAAPTYKSLLFRFVFFYQEFIGGFVMEMMQFWGFSETMLLLCLVYYYNSIR